MALLDKNIIITPYVGSATSDPRIEFRGADSTSGPNVISAVISPSNSGTLSFEGTAGQLFSITNNLTTGSIFSVNDVSGMPSIDVNANGTVSMVSYGGSIGIGITNPLQQLQVGFGTNVVVVDSTGELGIGTANPTSKIHVIGDVLATGNVTALQFTSTSDRNQKKNITPIKDAINIVNQLEGVRFNWVESNKPSIGVIAQDIERILPEVVETNQNGTKSVLYGNIIGVLIEAIKEQQIQIQELERKLDA